jgi:hypothetical protein
MRLAPQLLAHVVYCRERVTFIQLFWIFCLATNKIRALRGANGQASNGSQVEDAGEQDADGLYDA